MQAGRSLGPYEIIEQLGAGGMGEVWLAQDSRLGRKVAIKVLPEEFAADADRLGRFEQEARAAAALNHPHIAAVHDVGFEDGTHFMVQEYLEGQTVRELLEAGAVPLAKLLPLATEIGQALRAAHKAGIIHRDLKPDNVFVTEDGHAKVLDFGLAKLSEGAGLGGEGTKSPTVVGTMTGQIMGTAGYMAPEQIEGGDIDHRADLFAFGCLLYELATGRQPFAGKNVYETLGRIVSDEPAPLERSVAGLPAELQRIVRKSLAKDPELRYQTAGDVVVDLKMLASDVDAGTSTPSESGIRGDQPIPEPARGGLSWSLAAPAIIAALLFGLLAARLLSPTAVPPPAVPVRFDIPLPGEGDFFNRTNRVLTISPDGTQIVFTYQDQLWVRTVGELAAAPLRNTGNPREPTFSPDSTQIAFYADGQLKRIAVTGGAAVTVGPGPERRSFGIHWGDDGFIYFGAAADGIQRLAETGGQPEVVIEMEGNGFAYGPWLLPGREWILYTRASAPRDWNDGQIVAYSLVDGQERVLVEGGRDARFVSTGHLLYVRDGVLYALRFNPETATIAGGPVALVEQVRTAVRSLTGAAHYAISDGGHLVYVRGAGGAGGEANFTLAWVDAAGDTEALPFEPRGFNTMALSPDDRRLAVEERDGEGTQVWLYSVDRAGGQRLTTEGNSGDPVWTPDGEWVYFSSSTEGTPDIWRRRANLSAPAELVYESETPVFPWSISRDGEWLLYFERAGSTDVGRLSLQGEPTPEPLIATPANELFPTFSPDGQYLAYQSDESGRPEVYIHRVDSGERWLVSTGGGIGPRWARDGTELLYLWGGDLYAVRVETEPELRFEQPRKIAWAGSAFDYEVDLKGERTLQALAADAGGTTAEPITPRIYVVLNWFEELLALAPLGER